MAAALAPRPAPVPAPRRAPLDPAAPGGEDQLADVIPLRPRPARPSARVYRRRRIVAATVVVGLLLLAGLGVRSLVAPTGGAATATPSTVSVMLEPGDTLWDIAVAATADGSDPRVTLAEIRDLNGFGGDVVPAWTTVLVPAK